MRERKIGRRQFLKETGALVGGSLLAGPSVVFAGAKPGAKVEPMKLMTTTATFDPVRPESARLISQEFKRLGWDVEPLPIDYKQNVQKEL